MNGQEAESTDPSGDGFSKSTKPLNSNGWDGKARVERRAIITNPEALSDPEYSDEDAPPVEQIDADEGGYIFAMALLVFADLCHGGRLA